jgi:hypothetical protein
MAETLEQVQKERDEYKQQVAKLQKDLDELSKQFVTIESEKTKAIELLTTVSWKFRQHVGEYCNEYLH